MFNLIDGSWRPNGDAEVLVSPVDGSKLTGLPRLSAGEAKHAVHASAVAHGQWATLALQQSQRAQLLEALLQHSLVDGLPAQPSTLLSAQASTHEA